MRRKRIAVVALTVSAAIAALGAGQAQALRRRCVRAPMAVVATGHHGAGIPVRLEPGRHKRVLTTLRPNTLIWIETTPQLRRICPTRGFYPMMYENPVTYEEIWGWVAGGELRL
ncbi:MAG TPA: hypothetical protein VMG58_03610 [Candidatus Sulfotelmatobacter sp.]|nr:hypothetical protein [Candidatus Sulfotelmatobacter sp.]